MFGAQIGIDVAAPLADWVTLGFNARGGLFANRAKAKHSYVDGEVNLSDSFSESEWGVAGLVQAQNHAPVDGVTDAILTTQGLTKRFGGLIAVDAIDWSCSGD